MIKASVNKRIYWALQRLGSTADEVATNLLRQGFVAKPGSTPLEAMVQSKQRLGINFATIGYGTSISVRLYWQHHGVRVDMPPACRDFHARYLDGAYPKLSSPATVADNGGTLNI